jgi:hypothetical protein
MGTCFPVRTSTGCNLRPFRLMPGYWSAESPLSARSTNCGLETIPGVLGNDGKEIRTIEPSAVATIASRVSLYASIPRISESTHTNKRADLLFVPRLRALISTTKTVVRCRGTTLVVSGFSLEVVSGREPSDRLDFLRGLTKSSEPGSLGS